jgi:hypothetical protein
MGSSNGLMVVNVSTGTVTLEDLGGAVVAISPNGQFLVASNTGTGAIYYFGLSDQLVHYSYIGTTNTAAYTPDSNTVATFSGNTLYSGSSIAAPTTTSLPYTPAGLDISAHGGLTYITSPGLIDLLATCNIAGVQMLTASNPTLIKALPNGTGAIAADSPGIDVVTTPLPVSLGCPIVTQSSIANYDLGAGAYTAQQLIMGPDSSHAWIISNLPALLSFYLPTTSPTVIPYTGGVTAYTGGVTSDGTEVYVGASDGTVHRIAVASNSDVQQISISLKDYLGNPTVPNLVYVVP